MLITLHTCAPFELYIEVLVFDLIGLQVTKIFAENAFDAVMHFAAVAYVGESTLEPLR
jgi:UDP-glucose 4-epimerase